MQIVKMVLIALIFGLGFDLAAQLVLFWAPPKVRNEVSILAAGIGIFLSLFF
ncbi:hypothetical protein [Alicyclobacillus macrosporangiidus]|uniref:Uncharacterized protein n=1 Tax=Alicyclobacillus macrosporangiidus TaxID=392015 RepID=A0A1I7KC59_9BACL|nr:hypothetical protein [Alicyclobacillus macrosporangiidus]SFU94976.1 hypothetical protein SAMN05421543_11517 [Alicyclobacillus macrosporangiidus]